MDKRDVSGAPENAAWLEDLADRVLDDPDAKENFLSETLPQAAKSSRDFRHRLRDLVRSHRDPVVKEISHSLGLLVPWPPGAAIRLGDVGAFPSGASFVVQTQLGALGVNVEAELERLADEIEYKSPGVTLRTIQGDRRRIEFREPDSTFFQATGCFRQRIAEVTLARELMDLQQRAQWNDDWAVVTEVVVADQLVMLVSADGDGFVELDAEVAAPKAGPAPHGRALVSGHAGMRLTFLAGPGVVALYRVVKIKRSLWSSRDADPQLTVPGSYDEL